MSSVPLTGSPGRSRPTRDRAGYAGAAPAEQRTGPDQPGELARIRYATPDPSGPGAAKLLDNLRRLGGSGDPAAAHRPRRAR